MSVRQRDPLTGHETTGHEWDGITELNTQVPRVVLICIAVTHLWALVYWVLMPAWPLGVTYTKGLLGFDQQERVEEEVAEARAAREAWTSALASLPAEEIRTDEALMAHVGQTAPALYDDNCSPCHGRDGAGGPGFPSLVDEAWLWGGDAAAIMETLRVGINADHPETRSAQMLAFGANGLLDREQIRSVVDHVQSLSGLETEASAERLAAGATIYSENCTGCHGEDGLGIQEAGAPNLADDFWIYGGSDEAIFETIYRGRQGWMPAWSDRLSDAERMMLTLYIQDLAAEERR